MSYVRPVMPAGHKVTSADLEAILDQVDSLTAPGWTSYTPTWANTSTQPSVGNGSWTGSRYRRSDTGDLVHFEICLTWGSTTSGGTGSFWTFGFPPVTPSATELNNALGQALLFDTSAITRNVWGWQTFSSTILPLSASGTLATATSPWTWATGDTFKLRGFYEPA